MVLQSPIMIILGVKRPLSNFLPIYYKDRINFVALPKADDRIYEGEKDTKGAYFSRHLRELKPRRNPACCPLDHPDPY